MSFLLSEKEEQRDTVLESRSSNYLDYINKHFFNSSQQFYMKIILIADFRFFSLLKTMLVSESSVFVVTWLMVYYNESKSVFQESYFLTLERFSLRMEKLKCHRQFPAL